MKVVPEEMTRFQPRAAEMGVPIGFGQVDWLNHQLKKVWPYFNEVSHLFPLHVNFTVTDGMYVSNIVSEKQKVQNVPMCQGASITMIIFHVFFKIYS